MNEIERIVRRAKREKHRRLRRKRFIIYIVTILMVSSFFGVPIVGWAIGDNAIGYLLYLLIPTGYMTLLCASNGFNTIDNIF